MRTWITAVLMGFVFSFGITLATRAEAAPGQERETYYYSDSSFTTVVGYEYAGCDTNDRYEEGEVTRWYKRYWSACYPGTGSGLGCFVCTLDNVCVSTTCP